MPASYDLPTVDLATLAYTAGLVDGEGTISIRVHKRNKPRRYEEYQVALSVAQKDRTVLDWLAVVWKVGTVVACNTRLGDRVFTVHSWRTSANAASRVIAAILPYLHIKKQQAVIALGFQAVKDEWQTRKRVKGQRGTLPTPPHILDAYRTWTTEIQALNSRKNAA